MLNDYNKYVLNKLGFLFNLNVFLIGLVESQHDKQIEDLIKRVERKKREAYRENDVNSKINGDTSDKYDDYKIRV